MSDIREIYQAYITAHKAWMKSEERNELLELRIGDIRKSYNDLDRRHDELKAERNDLWVRLQTKSAELRAFKRNKRKKGRQTEEFEEFAKACQTIHGMK